MNLDDRRTLGLLLPPLLWLGVFLVAPLLLVVAVSFAARGAPVAATFDAGAWSRLWEPVHLAVIVRTALLSAGAALLCAAVGVPLAWFLVRQPPGRREALGALALLPIAVNSLVLSYAWIALLRPEGVIEQLLRAAGILAEGERLGWLYTPGAVLLGLVYWHLPFFLVPAYASLEKLDPRLLDAARDLGAGRRQTFFHVLLPLAWPGVAAGLALVFVQSFAGFAVPELLGGSKTLMVGALVQQRFLSLPQDWPLGAAMATTVLAGLGGALAARALLARKEAA